MNQNIKTFEKLWHEFEEVTKQKYESIYGLDGDDTTISDMINELSKQQGSIYNKEKSFITFCRHKRNLLSHGNYEMEYSVYTDDFIKAFKNILNRVKPKTVYSKSTKPVFSCDINEKISKVLQAMNQKNFTHIPIIEDKKMVGLISETSILKYLAENNEVILDQNELLCNNRDLIDLKYSKDNVLFFSKDDDYDIAVNKFVEEFKKGQKVSCILITQNGKENEGILGILTAWDIIGRDE